MKKIFAMLLAVIMVFSLATVAFATDEPVDTTVDTSSWTSAEQKKAIELIKVYTVTGSTDEELYPTETLKFTVAVPTGVTNPDTELVTVDDLVVAGKANQKIIINLPVYDTVGVYEYTITENDGTAQGVGYTDAAINVKVLVAYDYDNSCLTSEIVLATVTDAEGDTDGKVDTFTNTYDVGKLTVQKTVTGNLADSNAYFKMLVTFTAETDKTVESKITVSGGSLTGEGADGDPHTDGAQTNPTTIEESDWVNGVATKTIYLKAGDTLTFDNIPAGVSYTVVEDNYHILATGATVDPNSDHDKDYTVSYTSASGHITSNATDAAVVNNNKETSVSTGIALDSMPYVLILAVAAVGLVLFTTKKRVQE